MPLTETTIRRLPKPATPQLINDGRGLYLRHLPSGNKSFVFRTRAGGAWRVITLGKWPGVTLAAARAKAADLSGKTTPLPGAMTFGRLLETWFAEEIEPRYAIPKSPLVYVQYGKRQLGNVQLNALSTAKLVAVLRDYAVRSPTAANRALTFWRLALDHAVQTGQLESNPLARVAKRTIGGPEGSRNRVLTDEEIVTLWNYEAPAGNFFRFLLLTGLRISEGLHGRQEGTRWVLDSTKNKKPHWVHLPPLTLAQLAQPWPWRGMNEYQETLRTFCAMEIECDVPFTPHDLRRTCATRMAGLAGAQPWVVEKVLNHQMSGMMATYNRHSYDAERIEIAERWAEEIQRLVAEGMLA